MIKLNSKTYRWHSRANVHVCGFCFDAAGNMLRGNQLCAFFAECTDAASLVRRAREANGLFGVVIEVSDGLMAATDRLRRYPLFYNDRGELSDMPQALHSYGEWDEIGLAFYRASGAVLPGHTLLNDIRQLPPASVATYTSGGWAISPYASFLCTTSEQRACTPQQLDEVMLSVFRRMVESLDGRQVVVPLTSGNDSRLILCMLRRMNYSNVICYTVAGADGNEYDGAHQAAEQLGYPHYKIDMRQDEVRALCYAVPEDFDRYYRYVGALTNFCWLYDYVAIRRMQALHLLADDAVFVPGHSGDTFSGGHLVKADLRADATVRDAVRRMVYIGNEYEVLPEVREVLREYFSATMQAGYPVYSAYQNWMVQHRQAHNILNAIRVYDYCGYDVRLPLWDNALYDLFARLSYAVLSGCRLYTGYLQQLFAPYQLPVSPVHHGLSWFKIACRKQLKHLLPKPLLRRLRKTYDPIGEEMLSRPLGDELSRWLGYEHTCTNSNELLLQWYLMRVTEGQV